MAIMQSHSTLFSTYYRDRLINISLFFGIFANIGLWLLLIWQARGFSDSISLHYNIYFGIDLLGSWYQIFLLPSFGLAFIVINFIVGLAIYTREKILSYFLVWSGVFVQLIFILSAISIILINR